MDNVKEIIEQIKILSESVTEDTFNTRVTQGYELLVKLHDFGADKESVYRPLLEYQSSLADGISNDCISEIMDFVVGFCQPEKWIWNEDCAKKDEGRWT